MMMLAAVAQSAAAAIDVGARVAADFPKTPESGICRYSVPAMSETQYLPDAYPYDGVAGAPCTIIAAKDEYEPGAFLLYATKDFPKLDFTLGELKNEKGVVFPKEELDLTVVKVWYQNGNGWFSYFHDNGKKLCPELLLHDEDLVRVDTKTQDNYARLTEKDGTTSEYWITAPRTIYARSPGYESYWTPPAFAAMKENFSDAPVFKGASLKKGEFKEFLLTAHVRKDQPAGTYRGVITLKRQGTASVQQQEVVETVPVVLKVHDFVLPKPKTYFNLNQDFRVWFCEYSGIGKICHLNGGDSVLAKKQLLAISKNFVRHGYVIPCFAGAGELLDLCREAGMSFEGGHAASMNLGEPADMRVDVRKAVNRCDRDFGFHKGMLVSYGDEYGLAELRRVRTMMDFYLKEGFIASINSRSCLAAGIDLAGLWWPPVKPDHNSAPDATKYNLCGGTKWMGWYADQHVGTENPAFNRRQYGFGPYRAGLSASYNYAHHFDGWNDIVDTLYKPMMFVYGAGNGCIDTLAWEGFREGLDDIRYATLLKTLAEPLADSCEKDARTAGRLALKLLADADNDDMDLQTLRLEMIRWIEKMLEIKGRSKVEG